MIQKGQVMLQATTIPEMGDGYAGRLIDQEIATIMKDMEDRGQEDGKARKLTLELTFKPDKHGRVKVSCDVTAKLPKRTPPETSMTINQPAGGFTFRPDLAENPDQKTLRDFVDDKGEVLER